MSQEILPSLDDLLRSIGSLPPVPPGAAQAYADSADRLLERVNAAMEGDPRIRDLIGQNPLDLMRDNHRNHAAFLTTVLKINSYELLARTVPWVYRAYRARNFSYDYFPAELAAWKQAVEKCLDPAHAQRILPVYDWMIGHHESMIRISETGEGLRFSVRSESDEMQQVFLSLLLHGDSRGCLRMVEQSIQSVADLKHFYLEVVCPVMFRIGLLWEKNEVSVAEEHLATAIVGRAMATLYARFASIDAFRGKAVVAAGPNEFHEVGARMVADFLELEGWDVTYLGANTPGDEILGTLKRQRPFLAALSITVVFNLERVREMIAQIKADPETRGIKVLVGGPGFNALPLLWKDFGADGYAPDGNSAALAANEWWAGRSA